MMRYVVVAIGISLGSCTSTRGAVMQLPDDVVTDDTVVARDVPDGGEVATDSRDVACDSIIYERLSSTHGRLSLAGWGEVCVVRGGQVWCWGHRPGYPFVMSCGFPPCPDVSMSGRSSVERVGTLSNVIALSMWSSYYLALHRNGTVSVWGGDVMGVQPNPEASVPSLLDTHRVIRLVDGSNVVAIDDSGAELVLRLASSRPTRWTFMTSEHVGTDAQISDEFMVRGGVLHLRHFPRPWLSLGISRSWLEFESLSQRTVSGLDRCGRIERMTFGDSTDGGFQQVLSPTSFLDSYSSVARAFVSMGGCVLGVNGVLACPHHFVQGGRGPFPDGFVDVAMPGEVIDAVGNGGTICAVVRNGDVWCLGENTYGQAGQPPGVLGASRGGVNHVSRPTRIEGLPPLE